MQYVTSIYFRLPQQDRAKELEIETIPEVKAIRDGNPLMEGALDNLIGALAGKYPEAEFRALTTNINIDPYYNLFFSPAGSKECLSAVLDCLTFEQDSDFEALEKVLGYLPSGEWVEKFRELHAAAQAPENEDTEPEPENQEQQPTAQGAALDPALAKKLEKFLQHVVITEESVLIKCSAKAVLDGFPYDYYPGEELNRFHGKRLVIEEGVTAIKGCALSDVNWAGIVLPGTLEKIGESVFSGVDAPDVDLFLPESVRSIGGDFVCESRFHAVVMPAGLPKLKNSSLADSEIAILVMPKGMDLPNAYYETGANDRTFFGADYEEYPARERIEAYLAECDKKLKVEEVVVPEGKTSIGTGEFRYRKYLKRIVLPETISYIWGEAFSHCSDLTEIRLHDGIKEISYKAFLGCKSLRSIHIPSGIKEISSELFSGCESLESVEIPDLVEKVSHCAFAGCKSLKSIRLPETLKILSGSLLAGCASLESVRLPDGLEEIQHSVFCRSGLSSVIIPGGVKTIRDNAFSDCANLRHVFFRGDPASITANAFSGCVDITLHGPAGGKVESFAQKNGIAFLAE